jgi:putative intracellular protease/amidase
MIILPGSKNTLGDLGWLRESGMAHAVLQARRQGVPVLGICGGYQMLGETIIDEVESGLGTQPGLGLLNTVTHFAQQNHHPGHGDSGSGAAGVAGGNGGAGGKRLRNSYGRNRAARRLPFADATA